MAAIEPFSTVPHPARAGWSVQRVSFAASEPTRVLEFHPLLNVVVTPGSAVAAAVESLQTMLAGPDGTHVEFSLRDGTALVLFRPFGARHRLIDLDRGEERPMGELTPMIEALADDDPPTWRRDVETVSRLASLDQPTLWELTRQLQDPGAPWTASQPDHADDGGGSAHHGQEAAPRSRARRMLRRRVTPPGPAASTALPEVEAASIVESWRELAGPIDWQVALCQRDRVEAAALVPTRLGALAAVGPADARRAEPIDAVEVAEAVCTLIPASADGAGPHIVAVPGNVRPEIASLLLDQLAHLSQLRQVIVVTSDDAVIDWANLECHARRASLLRFDPLTSDG